MHRREIERFVQAVREMRMAGEQGAIATIVQVRGSAYRREGTRMLLRQDGTFECALSGGCLESSVAEAAADVMKTGQPRIVSYDLADDSLWGLGMGCGGAIDVRVEPLIDVETDDVNREWLTVLERGEAAVLVTPLGGRTGRVLIRATGDQVGHLDSAALDQQARERALARMADVRPRSGSERFGSSQLFFEMSVPDPELVIFGAGPDAPPLARLAWELGFSVTVVDVRAAYLTSARFPAAKLVSAHFDAFPTAVPLAPDASVLVMNHHLERDEESLRYALESPASYIGVLGPRPRYQILLEGLAEKGYTPPASRLARVHSPVGLSIGAESPEEIAVSIVGELVAVSRGFEGGFLSGFAGSLHRPDAKRSMIRS